MASHSDAITDGEYCGIHQKFGFPARACLVLVRHVRSGLVLSARVRTRVVVVVRQRPSVTIGPLMPLALNIAARLADMIALDGGRDGSKPILDGRAAINVDTRTDQLPESERSSH